MIIIRCTCCGLRQWVPVSGACRRCHTKLGFSLLEIPLHPDQDQPGKRPTPGLRVGPALRAMRLRQGRSQASVASRAGRVPRTSLSRYEADACAPSLATLARILTALGAESLYIRLGPGRRADHE